ncbi:MAG: hypothetical protein RIQ38_1810 [Pseudomonadota bacterium]|jgi:hypothetical protein
MTPSPTHTALLDALHLYFQGEKIEALVFILPIGLLSLVFGAWLLTDQPGGFAKGVAIPCVLMGLLMGTVGGVVGLRTPSQVAGIVSAIEANPKAAIEAEQARMTRVNQAWPKYLVIWGLMAVVGLLLRFATASDFWQGLGIALVFFGGVGLMVDGFAERRTHPYVDALQRGLLATPASP